MQQVFDFFSKLFDTYDWPPRWHCGTWSDFHGWLYIISDLLIWSAYFAIPIAILRFISRRVEARFAKTYFLFAAFILACGSTHLLDALIFWFPAYRLSALVRAFTGIISWITVFHIIRLMPMAMRMRSVDELEREVQERERAEALLQTAVNQLNEAQEIARMGHWQWDIASNEVSWSPGLFRVYGLPVASKGLSYELFLEKVHPEDRSFVDDSIRGAFSSRKFPVFTHRILLPDGSVRIMQAKGEVLLNGNGDITGMIGTGQDVTEQVEVQQALREKSAQLEASNQELQKFAYVASHDLQEPLRKIMTFISLMEQQQGMVSDEGQLYFKKISASAGRMQRLIDDILRFSSLHRTQSGFTRVELNEVFRNVVQDLEVMMTQSGAQISIGDLPAVSGIPSQLEQLFQNLVRNAIKFARPGVAPRVDVSGRILRFDELPEAMRSTFEAAGSIAPGVRGRQRWVEIRVADNGIGFEEMYAEKIFEIFQRLHNANAYQGTGIGLAIVKKIVEFHNGYVYAVGEPGEGAKFLVILPVIPSE